MIIKDGEALQRARDRRRCELCGSPGRGLLHPHHYIARGFGGGFRYDHDWNLAGICWICHRDVHDGKVPKRRILESIARRERLAPDWLEEQLWKMVHEGIDPRRGDG